MEQLRLVFAELHTVTIRDGVSFAGAWEQFDAQVFYSNPSAPESLWRSCWHDCTGGGLLFAMRATPSPTCKKHK